MRGMGGYHVSHLAKVGVLFRMLFRLCLPVGGVRVVHSVVCKDAVQWCSVLVVVRGGRAAFKCKFSL